MVMETVCCVAFSGEPGFSAGNEVRLHTDDSRYCTAACVGALFSYTVPQWQLCRTAGRGEPSPTPSRMSASCEMSIDLWMKLVLKKYRKEKATFYLRMCKLHAHSTRVRIVQRQQLNSLQHLGAIRLKTHYSLH